MEKISFPRHSRRESAEQQGRKKRKLHDIDENTATGYDGTTATSRLKGQEPAPALDTPSVESTKATPGEGEAGTERAVEGQDDPAYSRDRTKTRQAGEEMIPATSPVGPSPVGKPHSMQTAATEPELPTLADDGGGQGADLMETSSLPPVRRRTQRTYGTRKRHVRTNPFLSSCTSEALPAEPGDKAGQGVSTPESLSSTASTARPKTVSEDIG